MPRFSVIITVFNRPELVRQAIDSALGQTFTDREIIVVDDASTDGTAEVLKSCGGDICPGTEVKRIHVATRNRLCGARRAYFAG